MRERIDILVEDLILWRCNYCIKNRSERCDKKKCIEEIKKENGGTKE